MPVPPTDVVLIPGLWLDASSWQASARWLTRAGHRVHPVTPWTAADPAAVVAELVALVDGLGADARVVVAGHSAGCGLAHALVDARPDRIARSVLIGGFPTPDGLPLADGFQPVAGVVSLPRWEDVADEPDAEGFDAAGWAELAGRAVPVPEAFVTDPQRLTDERRLGVPVVVVCPEFRSSDLREWIDAGVAPVAELDRIERVDLVDLPTGHWPQLTRPDDLGRILVTLVEVDHGHPLFVDELGRPHPHPDLDEAAMLATFLDHHRATLAWRCAGLAAGDLARTLPPTDMTLAGLLKHLAYVEDHWFVRTLCGEEPTPPWDTVDWDADHDWDWHSAVADDPEELWRLWFAAVRRSRAATAEVLAADGITATAARSFGDDEPTPTLRWILTHMIEEYARHNGHADLLREAVDGQTGE